MSLSCTGSDIPQQTIGQGVGAFTAKAVCGPDASFMYATKPAGYHSLPHIHNCEQITYVLGGEIWAFIVDPKGRKYTFRMQAGDFKRVPKMAVHWSWNKSDSPCTLIEMHMPGLQADPALSSLTRNLRASWESAEANGAVRIFFVDPEHYAVNEIEQRSPIDDSHQIRLFRRSSDVPMRTSGGGNLVSQMVHGHAGSLMVANRVNRYHSKPHVHDCDQLNLVTKGDLSGYIVDPEGNGHAYHLQAGDFWRVPRMAVHWAFQSTGERCEMIECHCPGLQSGSSGRGLAASLFADYEDATTTGTPSNIFLDPALYPVEDTEALPPSIA